MHRCRQPKKKKKKSAERENDEGARDERYGYASFLFFCFLCIDCGTVRRPSSPPFRWLLWCPPAPFLFLLQTATRKRLCHAVLGKLSQLVLAISLEIEGSGWSNASYHSVLDFGMTTEVDPILNRVSALVRRLVKEPRAKGVETPERKQGC